MPSGQYSTYITRSSCGQGAPILENPAAPYGATAISGPRADRAPSKDELEAARELGERVAKATGWITWGRVERERGRARTREREAEANEHWA